MAIVLVEKVPARVSLPVASISDGKYAIKNRAAAFYWNAANNPITTVYFCSATMQQAKKYNHMQVNEFSPIIQVFRG
jgi:hypothetical protein